MQLSDSKAQVCYPPTTYVTNKSTLTLYILLA
jgi:hypothetical protein